jgi:hypothetical protein
MIDTTVPAAAPRQTLVIPAGGVPVEPTPPPVVVVPPREAAAPAIEKGMPPPAAPFDESTIEDPLPEDK